MQDKPRLLHRYPLIFFFALCFLLSWSIWIPVGILNPESVLLVLPGAWVPTLAALLITFFTEGRTGIRELISSLAKWRVAFRYYAFAIFSILGLAMLAIGVGVLLGGAPPDLVSLATRFGLPAEQASLFFVFAPILFIIGIFAGGPVAEELGWRGFAQPRLQAHLGESYAGLVIGFIWSLWHLPLIYLMPSIVGGLSLIYYVPPDYSNGSPICVVVQSNGGERAALYLVPCRS